MGNSAFILNHRVMSKSNPKHGAIGRSRLLYIANRPGVVIEKTQDQLVIEANTERMAKLGYIAYRPGADRNTKLHHGLFDQRGIPNRSKIAHELTHTDSAIVTSVLSVRREDAEALGLTTRQDWERLLRSQWSKHIEEMGIIAPENIRWVAAYHTNQVNNLHVHVFTWDDSGAFDSLIPKPALVKAHDAFCAAVLKPHQEQLNLARTQARDELLAQIKSFNFSDDQLQSVKDMLPEKGSLKYANLAKWHPEITDAINTIIRQSIQTRPELLTLQNQYCKAVYEYAQLKSLSGYQRELYIHVAEKDLQVRLGNAFISRIHPQQRIARPDFANHISYEMSLTVREEKAQRAFFEEVASNLSLDDKRKIISRFKNDDVFDACILQKLPSVQAKELKMPGYTSALSQATSRSVATMHQLLRQSLQAERNDAGDEVANATLRMLSNFLFLSIRHVLSSSSVVKPRMKLHITKGVKL